jgi:hypothetical protein
MPNINDLLNKMAATEAAFAETRFVAPCVRGGRVRARVGGVVQTFRPDPAEFEGWGLFQPAGEKATVLEEANLPLVAAYLRHFPLLRLRLARQLSGQMWLAYPASEGDMRQRFGEARPVAVHLVTEGAALEQVTARCVGGVWWFEETDRRADPVAADRLRDALRDVTVPEDIRFAGLTPEMRTAYELAVQTDPRFEALRRQREEEQRRRAEQQYRAEFGYEWHVEAHRDEYDAAWGNTGEPDALNHPPAPQNRRGHRHGMGRNNRGEGDELRLRDALHVGGGDLRAFNDRGAYWLVEWTTADGQRHTSAVAKGDLTVISSGICLSGRDRDFDLQSLVGVIEGREW